MIRPIAATAFLLMSGFTYAHHSTLGFYDHDKIVEIEGVVTRVSLRNPHIRINVEVTDDSGATEDWNIESSALSVLLTRGLDPDFIKVGDHVKVAGSSSKRGRPEMYTSNILLPDGTEALINITAEPYFTDPDSGRVLGPVFDSEVEQLARNDADGIFRVWSTVLGDPASFPMFKGDYPLTAAATQVRSDWNPTSDALLSCWRKGMPLLMITPIPIEFTRKGNDIVIRFGEDDAERLIHMNTADQGSPEVSSLLGYSSGRWEGDTLVVETVNIDAPNFDDRGTPQGQDISLVERFTLSADKERLDYRISVTDAETFTKPFDLTRYWVWRPEIAVQEWDCESTAG
jgi:hypothetical protein